MPCLVLRESDARVGECRLVYQRLLPHVVPAGSRKGSRSRKREDGKREDGKREEGTGTSK